MRTLFGRWFAVGFVLAVVAWSLLAKGQSRVETVELRYLAFFDLRPEHREPIRATTAWAQRQTLGRVLFDVRESTVPLEIASPAEEFGCLPSGGFSSECGWTQAFQGALTTLLAPLFTEGDPVVVVSVAASGRAHMLWLNIGGRDRRVLVTYQGDLYPVILAHELGHALGLAHANRMHCGPPVLQAGERERPFDIRALTQGALRAELFGSDIWPGCQVLEYQGFGTMGVGGLDDGFTPDMQAARGWRGAKTVAVFPARVRFDASPLVRVERAGMKLDCWWRAGVMLCSVPDDTSGLYPSWQVRAYSLGDVQLAGLQPRAAVVGESWCDPSWGLGATLTAVSPPSVTFDRCESP